MRSQALTSPFTDPSHHIEKKKKHRQAKKKARVDRVVSSSRDDQERQAPVPSSSSLDEFLVSGESERYDTKY